LAIVCALFNSQNLFWTDVIEHKKKNVLGRAMKFEYMDKKESRHGAEEILYRSIGGECAAMALRSPWPRASISGACRMPLYSSM
jgi:hypothetical protein